METFIWPLDELKEFNDLKKDIKLKQLPVQITGCIGAQKSNIIYGVSKEIPFKIIITSNELKANEIYEDYKLYDKDVYIYPSKDTIFYSADIRGNAITQNRMQVLRRIIENKPTTIILTIDAGMEKILPIEFIKERRIIISEVSIINISKLSKDLIDLGYERQSQVETAGEFAIRGGIIDIFPLTEEMPVRIELWGDEIDSIRSFDVESQRSIDRVDELTIYPATEIILDSSKIVEGVRKIDLEAKVYIDSLRKNFKTEESARIKNIIEEFKENITQYQGSIPLESYINFFYDKTMSFFDYFSNDNSMFFLDEPNRLIEKGEAVEIEFRESMVNRIEKGYILPTQIDVLYNYNQVLDIISKRNSILISTIESKINSIIPKKRYDFTVQTIPSYNKNFNLLVKDLKKWKNNKYRVILLSSSRTRAKRLSEDLLDNNINAFYSDDKNRVLQKGEVMVTYGNLRRGFEYSMIGFVVISESDIFGVEKKKRKKQTKYESKKIQKFTELFVGDYVVHESHGLGIYKGIEQIEIEKIIKDFIKIEYGDGGILYIPTTDLDVIGKYASGESRKPKLNKLNSVEWKNTKTRVKNAVQDMAAELVELYAKRQAIEGFCYGEDTVWQREFEEAFPYEETEDQLNAIEDTKKDMESRKVMDRLICGDVGYGKTEVAIRAAFKAVSDGKQVVILVPTTILAQQHYNTFVQRMMDYPISVDMLSRFKSPSEQKKVIERLNKGSLDIVVGTHRVLSGDIKFKDLGLLIVDEEQRFGVAHKEKIKKLRGNVDVLTLTATPIPRTLHMSLIGIRDMSVLEEPPVDRMPIQTFVMEHNDEIIREGINRELARGGQVYYVYNRVNGIDEIANNVASLVPDANVAFAHGQMNERTLERIMYDFISGEIDVLISTTIIETGLDISNVNTIIIDDADRLGLSQLYQLRGRVGRSNRTSFAFLMYKRDKMLKEVAEKRLHAIKEFTELGSGFKIAMRDLEIRGAGNLLGSEQSGHMEAVGYDLYCKMLNEAVKYQKGEKEEENFEISINLDVDIFIPSTYIKSEYQKLDTYKRIAEVETMDELLDMQEELIDRFGDIPSSVNNLLHISLLKSLARMVYVLGIEEINSEVILRMHPEAKIKVEDIPKVIDKYRNKLKLIPDAIPYFVFNVQRKKTNKNEDIIFIESIISLLNDFKDILLEK